MRAISTSLVVALLFAQHAMPKDDDGGIKKLKVPAIPGMAEGSVKKPATIDGAKALAAAFPDKDIQEQVAKQLNFDEQVGLYFTWSGSGQDRLAFQVDKGGKMAVFLYTPGLTRDLRSHRELFALPKGMKWEVRVAKR